MWVNRQDTWQLLATSRYHAPYQSNVSACHFRCLTILIACAIFNPFEKLDAIFGLLAPTRLEVAPTKMRCHLCGVWRICDINIHICSHVFFSVIGRDFRISEQNAIFEVPISFVSYVNVLGFSAERTRQLCHCHRCHQFNSIIYFLRAESDGCAANNT